MGEHEPMPCGCTIPIDRLVALVEPEREVMLELGERGTVIGGFPHASPLLRHALCAGGDLPDLLHPDLARLIAEQAEVVRTRGVAASVHAPDLEARIAALGANIVVLLRKVPRAATERAAADDASFWQLFEAAPLPLALEVEHPLTGSGPSRLNRRFTEVFGYTAEDIPTIQHWWPRAYPDPEQRRTIRDEWVRRVQQAIGDQTAIEPMETTVTCKDGTPREIEFFAAAVGERQVVVFVDLTERKRLQAAQAEVAALSALLPLCAWCKKTRDDQGYWQKLEEYVSKRLGTRITHGICPECASEYLGGRKPGPGRS
jgi:PAS domain-containing protein